MFLRKLFSSENKLVWVLVDLLIVIIGVYCAFLIQNYSEAEKTEKEKEKIYSALKFELEQFRYTALGITAGIEGRLSRWNRDYPKGTYLNFSDWKFIEPQYNYQIVEHSINIDNNEIIDFELYSSLQRLYVEIKKVEFTERIITDLALKYKNIPTGLDESSTSFKLIDGENLDNYERFLMYTRIRRENLAQVVRHSISVLTILNDRMPENIRKRIEEDLIRLKMPDVPSEERAVLLTLQFFPNWTKEEVLKIHREIHQPESSVEADSVTDEQN